MYVQEDTTHQHEAYLQEAAAIQARYRGALESSLALGRNPITDHLVSYEAFQSAESAKVRRRVIRRAGLEHGFVAKYNDANGTVEVDVEDLPRDVLAKLFACNARPVNACAPLWLLSFADVASFYKALDMLDEAQRHVH